MEIEMIAIEAIREYERNPRVIGGVLPVGLRGAI